MLKQASHPCVISYGIIVLIMVLSFTNTNAKAMPTKNTTTNLVSANSKTSYRLISKETIEFNISIIRLMRTKSKNIYFNMLSAHGAQVCAKYSQLTEEP